MAGYKQNVIFDLEGNTIIKSKGGRYVEILMVAARLGCLLFGGAVGVLLSQLACARLCGSLSPGAAKLMQGMLALSKTVVACAVSAVVSPLPVDISILYTGFGVLWTGRLPSVKEKMLLSVLCPWLILYLPITGGLACVGGGLLVLAADVPAMAGLAMVVLAAPMALLQFGGEGGAVLLLAAGILCPEQIAAAWREGKNQKITKKYLG